MIEKVVQDNKATDAEMGLVNSTGIPIMKILTIESAYKHGLLRFLLWISLKPFRMTFYSSIWIRS